MTDYMCEAGLTLQDCQLVTPCDSPPHYDNVVTTYDSVRPSAILSVTILKIEGMIMFKKF